MPLNRGARSSAPPPITPVIAARFPTRWRRPIPGRAADELSANPAIVGRASGARWKRLAPGPDPASFRRARGRHRGLGPRGAHQQHSALCAAGTRRGVWNAGRRLASAVAIAADYAGHHAGRFCGRRRRRHRARAIVQSIEMAGIFAVSLCGDPAGHAGDCDRAAAPDLSAAADRRDRLRLDRGVLSGIVEYHARTEFGRSKSGRAVSTLRRVAAADAALSQIAGGAALHPRRIADRRRPVPDRRRGRRDRGGDRGRRFRPRLSHCRVRLPAQHSPNVRGAVAALARRDCHLWSAGANFASGTATLARERAWKGKLMTAGNISSEKVDLLIYGPVRPILENGFSDQFVLHMAESRADLERLTPDVLAQT